MKFKDFLNEAKHVKWNGIVEDDFDIGKVNYMIEYDKSDKCAALVPLIKSNVKKGTPIDKKVASTTGISKNITSTGSIDWTNDEEQTMKARIGDAGYKITKLKTSRYQENDPEIGYVEIKIKRYE